MKHRHAHMQFFTLATARLRRQVHAWMSVCWNWTLAQIFTPSNLREGAQSAFQFTFSGRGRDGTYYSDPAAHV